MKKLALIAFLAVLTLPALCDGTGTLIQWYGWTLESTEDVWMGHRHTSFPLTQMLDGDPTTTWVFSGLEKRPDGMKAEYGITLSRDEGMKAVTVDGLWIMNGHNKSKELFLRNNRITELKLYVNGKYLKTVSLADSMGWHKVSIPRKPIREIEMRFTGFNKGRDNDTCVSEIALYDGEKQIDLKMPKAVIYTEGSDCGCGQAWCMIDRKGKILASYSFEDSSAWSQSYRYVAAANAGDAVNKPCRVWVADVSTGEVIMDRPVGKSDDWITDLRWKGEETLILELETCTYHKGSDEPECKYRKETIKVTGE